MENRIVYCPANIQVSQTEIDAMILEMELSNSLYVNNGRVGMFKTNTASIVWQPHMFKYKFIQQIHRAVAGKDESSDFYAIFGIDICQRHDCSHRNKTLNYLCNLVKEFDRKFDVPFYWGNRFTAKEFDEKVMDVGNLNEVLKYWTGLFMLYLGMDLMLHDNKDRNLVLRDFFIDSFKDDFNSREFKWMLQYIFHVPSYVSVYGYPDNAMIAYTLCITECIYTTYEKSSRHLRIHEIRGDGRINPDYRSYTSEDVRTSKFYFL